MIKLIHAQRKNPELSLDSRRRVESNKTRIRVMELAQLSLSTRFSACTFLPITTNLDSDSLYKQGSVTLPGYRSVVFKLFPW